MEDTICKTRGFSFLDEAKTAKSLGANLRKVTKNRPIKMVRKSKNSMILEKSKALTKRIVLLLKQMISN